MLNAGLIIGISLRQRLNELGKAVCSSKFRFLRRVEFLCFFLWYLERLFKKNIQDERI